MKTADPTSAPGELLINSTIKKIFKKSSLTTGRRKLLRGGSGIKLISEV